MSNSLEKMIKPGKKVRVYFGENNPNNVEYHIRAIVDDDYVVVKHWLKHKKRWSYRVEPMFWFEMLQEKGALFGPKKKKADK